MGESNSRNERSVELAVRRELDYKHKLACSGFNPENPRRELTPLQEPSSSYRVKESNPSSKPMPTSSQFRLSQPLPRPTSNQPHNPNPKPVQPPNPIYKPLRLQNPQNQERMLNSYSRPVTTFTTANATPNLSGTKRKEIMSNVQDSQSQKPKPSPPQSNYVTMTPEGYSYCNICDVPCSGRSNLQQHLKGDQHKNKMQLLEWTKKGVSRPFCGICKIYCTDEDGLKMHYKGQKHQSKLRQMEVGDERKEHRTCDLCKIWCMDEGAYQQHLKGKKHITRLYAAENSNNSSI